MTGRRFFTPSPAMVVATIALFVAMGGTSYAVISGGVPDSHGVFHACVNRVNGAIRVVTSAGKCAKPRGHGKHRTLGELAVAWSQTGPRGLTGPPGSNATINGVAAGGALAGTYPNPTLASGAVTPSAFGTIPAAVVTNSGDTSIPGDASHNQLSFDTAQVNDGGVYSSTNSNRLTAPVAGLYAVHGEAKWGAQAGGFRELEIYSSSVGRVGVTTAEDPGALGVIEGVTALVHMSAGDYLYMDARQTSGSAITITGTTNEGAPDTPEFDMHWVGP